jgi:hypothetical protein
MKPNFQLTYDKIEKKSIKKNQSKAIQTNRPNQ